MQSYNLTDAKKINIAVAVTLLYVPLMGYIEGQFGHNGIYHVVQGLYLLSFLFALPSIIKCINIKVILFVTSFSFFFLLSYLGKTDIDVFQQALRNIFLWCLPYFVLSFSVRNYEDIIRKFKYVSLLMLIIGYLRTFTLTFSSDNYSQDLGYDVLLPFIVYFLALIKERKIWYIIPIVVSFALMLMSGSRGPLLCAIAGAILAYIIVNGINKKDIFILILISIICVIYNIYRIQILNWTLYFFSSLDVSVRSVEMLLYNDISDDQSRHRLRMIAINYILDHPFIGSGFINDRAYIYSQYIINKTATVYGSYCHNFFLEIMMQFGLMPGLFVIVVFLKKIFSIIRHSISKMEKEYIVIVLTIGFFPLLVSRSWITFHMFYMVIGLCLLVNKKGKECLQ